MNEFRPVTLSRKDLQAILDAFDNESEYVHFGLEIDSTRGDQILWVDNGKFENDRGYIKINKAYYQQK